MTTTLYLQQLAAAEEQAWARLLDQDLIGDYEPNTDNYEYQQALAEGRL
jgi:hypothetical protein